MAVEAVQGIITPHFVIREEEEMTGEQKVEDLFDDALIKEKVIKVWSGVFEASSRVLTHANNYGFRGMVIIPSPNIHEMLISLQIFSSIIDIFIASAEKLNVDYEEIRLMLNAKEQITRMERVAAALKANNREDFDAALTSLEGQAAF